MDSGDLCVADSTGPTTAKAVTVLHELDREIRENSEQSASLDEVVRALSTQSGDITLAALRSAAESLLGGPSRTLDSVAADNCS